MTRRTMAARPPPGRGAASATSSTVSCDGWSGRPRPETPSPAPASSTPGASRPRPTCPRPIRVSTRARRSRAANGTSASTLSASSWPCWSPPPTSPATAVESACSRTSPKPPSYHEGVGRQRLPHQGHRSRRPPGHRPRSHPPRPRPEGLHGDSVALGRRADCGRLTDRRRLARDCETHPHRSEAMIHIAMIDLMSQRLTRESTRDRRGTQFSPDGPQGGLSRRQSRGRFLIHQRHRRSRQSPYWRC